MDASGNNRYELLFMDDEGIPSAPAITVPPKKKATPSVASATAPKNPQTANKSSTKVEKENKAGTLNKNESGKKVNGAVAANQSGSSPKQDMNADGNRNRNRPNNSGETSDGNNRNIAFKSQNYTRRNVREGGEGRGTGFGNAVSGEFNNEQQRPRPSNRDRDNRGPPRNRYGENSFRGKREFDRQSGSDKTGVKSVDKRDGAGAHNWGSVKQEIEEINKSSADAETSLTDKEDSPNEQSTDQVALPEEEETKEMTLDEWKAMRQQRTKPQFNLRKAGEGEDETQWKKMVVLDKKKEGGESEEEFEYDPSLYPQRVGRLQRIVDIQFNFSDSRRSNGGSGGFGRGRGRGPRPGGGGGAGVGVGADKGRFDSAPRGGNTFGDAARGNSGQPRNFGERTRGAKPIALKVDDERQFPTLS